MERIISGLGKIVLTQNYRRTLPEDKEADEKLYQQLSSALGISISWKDDDQDFPRYICTDDGIFFDRSLQELIISFFLTPEKPMRKGGRKEIPFGYVDFYNHGGYFPILRETFSFHWKSRKLWPYSFRRRLAGGIRRVLGLTDNRWNRATLSWDWSFSESVRLDFHIRDYPSILPDTGLILDRIEQCFPNGGKT